MQMPHSPTESFVGGNDDKFPTLLIKLVRYAASGCCGDAGWLLVENRTRSYGAHLLLLALKPWLRQRWKVGAQLHNECFCLWLVAATGSRELFEGVYLSLVFWFTSPEPYIQYRPTEANANGKFKPSLRCYMTPILQNGSRRFPQPPEYDDDFRMKGINSSKGGCVSSRHWHCAYARPSRLAEWITGTRFMTPQLTHQVAEKLREWERWLVDLAKEMICTWAVAKD